MTARLAMDTSLIDQLVYYFDLFGTAVFAFSGVLVAGRLRMDAIGVIVLAAVTAIGGGTIRDLLIGASPIFWIQDPTYLWVILATAAAGMWLARVPRRLPWYALPVADAFGLALFVVIGAKKALLFGTSGMVAVVMGVITGVAGGLIRDVLQLPASQTVVCGMAMGYEDTDAPVNQTVTARAALGDYFQRLGSGC